MRLWDSAQPDAATKPVAISLRIRVQSASPACELNSHLLTTCLSSFAPWSFLIFRAQKLLADGGVSKVNIMQPHSCACSTTLPSKSLSQGCTACSPSPFMSNLPLYLHARRG